MDTATDYTVTDTSPLIDGERVIDRAPTPEEVRRHLAAETLSIKGYEDKVFVADRTKMLAVNPTPCGVYDGDEMRWEVSEIVLDTSKDGGVEVYYFLDLFRTLDDAVEFASARAERVYIMRSAV